MTPRGLQVPPLPTDEGPAPHWLDGQWIESGDGAVEQRRDPVQGAPLPPFAVGGRAEAEAAVAAARRAFDCGYWAQSPRLRAEVLFAFADAMARHREALAQLLMRETGKLLRVARLEIDASVSELRYYAGLARAITGRMLEVEPGSFSFLSREPAGVAAIIVPWNAPGILLVRSLAPALAAGCCVVLKPAAQSALFHAAVMRCFAEVESLPRGVVNSVAETGSAVAEAFVASPDVDLVSFTGSSATGKRIMAAAAGTLKRLNLELGGKAPCIVFDDVEATQVAPRLAAAATILAGQQCTAASRILVQARIAERLAEAIGEAFRHLRVGLPDAPGSELGPLIDPASRDRVLQAVETASRQGRVLYRGEIPADLPAGGAFLRPSLVAVEDLAASTVQEEIFGPVLNLEPFQDEAEAVQRANATRYGLAASVWTGDGARALRVARALRSGTVWLNEHNKLFPEAETGGFKESGFGRLHGVEGLNEFLATKHIYQPVGTLSVAGRVLPA